MTDNRCRMTDKSMRRVLERNSRARRNSRRVGTIYRTSSKRRVVAARLFVATSINVVPDVRRRRWRHGRHDIRHGARLTSALFLNRQPSCRLKRIRKVPLNNLRKLRRRRRVDLVEKLRRRSGPKEKYVTS